MVSIFNDNDRSEYGLWTLALLMCLFFPSLGRLRRSFLFPSWGITVWQKNPLISGCFSISCVFNYCLGDLFLPGCEIYSWMTIVVQVEGGCLNPALALKITSSPLANLGATHPSHHWWCIIPLCLNSFLDIRHSMPFSYPTSMLYHSNSKFSVQALMLLSNQCFVSNALS